MDLLSVNVGLLMPELLIKPGNLAKWAKFFKGEEIVNNAGSIDDLLSWAGENGLSNLTEIEIKGTLDLFEGNIQFAQKALLSSKEIVIEKTLSEHFN
jgi:hypothetical protein